MDSAALGVHAGGAEHTARSSGLTGVSSATGGVDCSGLGVSTSLPDQAPTVVASEPVEIGAVIRSLAVSFGI